MAVDFSGLVLGPCQDVYSDPVLIDPRSSQPGMLPYPARGIFRSRGLEIPLTDASVLVSQHSTFDIRLSEFTVPPQQGDHIILQVGNQNWPPNTQFFIDDYKADGQGGASMSISALMPAELLS